MFTKANSFLLFFILLFSCFKVNAQLPQKISYQAVLRDASNALLVNKQIGVRISILQGSDTGTAVFIEPQVDQTNDNGLMSMEIGTGTFVMGEIEEIEWGLGPYFIKLEIDPLGGTNYSISGANELLSVPYAFYAGKSNIKDGTSIGEMMYWDGSKWERLMPPESLPGRYAKPLKFCNGKPIWGDCPIALASSTLSVSEIYVSGAKVQVDITSDGGGTISERGIVWSLNPNPTVTDTKVISTSISNTFSITLLNIFLEKTPFYVRSYLINETGISYGANTKITTIPVAIGQSYLGGKVFYILKPNDLGYDPNRTKGLIFANSNIPYENVWGCSGTNIVGADSAGIGYGNLNTSQILAGCTNSPSAASVCNNFISNGYTDWYLGTKEEMIQLKIYNDTFGGISTGAYWTSTEFNSLRAFVCDISTGLTPVTAKIDYKKIIPIRSF